MVVPFSYLHQWFMMDTGGVMLSNFTARSLLYWILFPTIVVAKNK